LIDVPEANARFAISEHTLVDHRDVIAVRYFGGGERVVRTKHVQVIGHIYFSKMTFEWLDCAPGWELAWLEGPCFDFMFVPGVVIPSSVNVIGAPSFREASIEAVRCESGSHLQRLESEDFVDCSL
jgi:hypothetical protein